MYLTTRKQFRRTTIVIMSIYLSIPSLERLYYMYVPDTSHGNKNKMIVKSFNRSYKYYLSVGVFIASSWALTPALFFSSSQRIRNLWS